MSTNAEIANELVQVEGELRDANRRLTAAATRLLRYQVHQWANVAMIRVLHKLKIHMLQDDFAMEVAVLKADLELKQSKLHNAERKCDLQVKENRVRVSRLKQVCALKLMKGFLIESLRDPVQRLLYGWATSVWHIVHAKRILRTLEMEFVCTEKGRAFHSWWRRCDYEKRLSAVNAIRIWFRQETKIMYDCVARNRCEVTEILKREPAQHAKKTSQTSILCSTEEWKGLFVDNVEKTNS